MIAVIINIVGEVPMFRFAEVVDRLVESKQRGCHACEMRWLIDAAEVPAPGHALEPVARAEHAILHIVEEGLCILFGGARGRGEKGKYVRRSRLTIYV